jgi:hypothetical protein
MKDDGFRRGVAIFGYLAAQIFDSFEPRDLLA